MQTVTADVVVVTADVVVVGAGPAGMAAAAAARGSGASVAVVEAGAAIGGNAMRSNGYLAFVGSPPQLAHGIDDDGLQFLADARRVFDTACERFGLVWDEDVVRLFAAESAATYRLLTSRGVRFTHLVPRPEHGVDRILAVQDPGMFARAFAADFASPAVRTLFGIAPTAW
jgi:succinate dehydrogenase/fumarate reductase flavoprotein subunit